MPFLIIYPGDPEGRIKPGDTRLEPQKVHCRLGSIYARRLPYAQICAGYKKHRILGKRDPRCQEIATLAVSKATQWKFHVTEYEDEHFEPQRSLRRAPWSLEYL